MYPYRPMYMKILIFVLSMNCYLQYRYGLAETITFNAYVAQISPWAYQVLNWCVENDIMVATTDMEPMPRLLQLFVHGSLPC